jgi:membrane-associated protease RseP (regulator of RpoE activity)
MIRFKLFGIPVQVQPWFWLSLVLIGGGVGANTKQELLLLALFVLAGFVSILVHELGHALAGRACGAQSAVTLHAFGGFAEFSGAWFTRKQSFLVTAAGPGVQFLLGVLTWLLIRGEFMPRSYMDYFLVYLSFISVFWAVLNLLPVMPLDGGQMLNAMMGPARIRITLWVSIITAGVTAVATLKLTNSVVFPLLLVFFAYQAWKALRESQWR